MAKMMYSPQEFNGAILKSAQVTARSELGSGIGTLGTVQSVITAAQEFEIQLDLLAQSAEVATYFLRLFRNELPPNNTMGLHLIENEFLCAWCGKPNPITGRFCSQCGAPRGFIIRR